MKRIGLIFDSKYSIGGGHFWRCFNLAKMLEKKDRKFFFISNYLKSNFIKLLNENNYTYVKINRIEKIYKISSIIDKFKLNILVTDCYDFNLSLKKKLKSKVDKLIVIDDYVNKKHNCDIFINHNFMNEKSKKMIKTLNPKSQLFLGTDFFISNKKLFQKNRIRNNNIKEVFVFFGSSDPSNETFKVAKLLHRFNKLNFNILIGKLNKNYKKISKYCGTKKNIKTFYNLNNDEVIRLMKRNDFSIGSGGINLTERLFIGLPSIVISIAKNQEKAVKELKARKLIYYLGSCKKVSSELIKKSIFRFIKEEKLFKKFKKKISLIYKSTNNFEFFKYKLNLIIDKSS